MLGANIFKAKDIVTWGLYFFAQKMGPVDDPM